MTEETWIAEGAEVAVVRRDMDRSIDFARIARLTPTQIVLDNGNRYRRGGNHTQLSVGRNSLSTRLVDPNTPAIVNTTARKLLAGFVSAAQQYTHGSTATIYQLDAAGVRAVFNELADKLNAARKELDRRAGL